MTSYSPFRQLAVALDKVTRDSERAQLREAKRKAKMPAFIARASQYLEETHRYQLMVSGKPEGEPVEMQGIEAKEQNRIFKERYSAEINAAIDAGLPYGQTGAKSRHWKWLKDA